MASILGAALRGITAIIINMFNFTLHQDEQIKQIYRQTALVLCKPLLLLFALLYLPGYFLARYELFSQFQHGFYFWAILVLIYAGNKLLLWSLNSYLITSQRLVIVIYRHLFSKQVIETPIERILNISFKRHGFWASMLNFGDVVVQVVGLTEPIVLKRVRHPETIKDYLWQIHIALVPQHDKAFHPDEIEKIQQRLGYGQAGDKSDSDILKNSIK